MSFSEILDHRGLWTLLGVLVGFGFSEISSRMKKASERSDCKIALIDEVRFNHAQTVNKIDIVKQAAEALSNRKFMSTKCGRYSTTEFESLFHVAVPVLSVVEKDNLRHLHSFYVRIDDLLDGFDSQFRADVEGSEKREATIDSVYAGHLVQMKDIRDSLVMNLNLSENLIKGTPLPIFGENQA